MLSVVIKLLLDIHVFHLSHCKHRSILMHFHLFATGLSDAYCPLLSWCCFLGFFISWLFPPVSKDKRWEVWRNLESWFLRYSRGENVSQSPVLKEAALLLLLKGPLFFLSLLHTPLTHTLFPFLHSLSFSQFVWLLLTAEPLISAQTKFFSYHSTLTVLPGSPLPSALFIRAKTPPGPSHCCKSKYPI